MFLELCPNRVKQLLVFMPLNDVKQPEYLKVCVFKSGLKTLLYTVAYLSWLEVNLNFFYSSVNVYLYMYICVHVNDVYCAYISVGVYIPIHLYILDFIYFLLLLVCCSVLL